MLDKADKSPKTGAAAGPPLDFQDHLRRLEARGLVTRIDHPINKDTELHPLVRWQFSGGIAEADRRAFLFTNVVDSKGRRYDIPVAVGALAAPRIYAVGMGAGRGDRRGLDPRRRASDPPVVDTAPACQEVVVQGDALLKPGEGLARLPVPISTPGFDSAPYLTATLCITRDPEPACRTWAPTGALESEGPPRRAHVVAPWRRRRLSPLAEISKAKTADAVRDRHRLRAGRDLYRTAKFLERHG